jgi:hypothetical protein
VSKSRPTALLFIASDYDGLKSGWISGRSVFSDILRKLNVQSGRKAATKRQTRQQSGKLD